MSKVNTEILLKYRKKLAEKTIKNLMKIKLKKNFIIYYSTLAITTPVPSDSITCLLVLLTFDNNESDISILEKAVSAIKFVVAAILDFLGGKVKYILTKFK